MGFGQLEWLRRKIQPGLDSINAHVTEAKDAILNLIAGNTTHIVNYVVSSKADILNQMNQGVTVLGGGFPKIIGGLSADINYSNSIQYDGAGYFVVENLTSGSGSSHTAYVDDFNIGSFVLYNTGNLGPVLPFSRKVFIQNNSSSCRLRLHIIFVTPPLNWVVKANTSNLRKEVFAWVLQGLNGLGESFTNQRLKQQLVLQRR